MRCVWSKGRRQHYCYWVFSNPQFSMCTDLCSIWNWVTAHLKDILKQLIRDVLQAGIYTIHTHVTMCRRKYLHGDKLLSDIMQSSFVDISWDLMVCEMPRLLSISKEFSRRPSKIAVLRWDGLIVLELTELHQANPVLLRDARYMLYLSRIFNLNSTLQGSVLHTG